MYKTPWNYIDDRALLIVELREDGYTYRQLAETFSLSANRIYQIYSRTKAIQRRANV